MWTIAAALPRFLAIVAALFRRDIELRRYASSVARRYRFAPPLPLRSAAIATALAAIDHYGTSLSNASLLTLTDLDVRVLLLAGEHHHLPNGFACPPRSEASQIPPNIGVVYGESSITIYSSLQEQQQLPSIIQENFKGCESVNEAEGRMVECNSLGGHDNGRSTTIMNSCL
ncbi:hypothetical protein CR513_24432, partial [Mucuna pruriens]